MSKTTGSIMQRLRDETTEHHKRAESRPLERALFTAKLPKSVFVDVLAQRLLIHEQLDARLRRLAADDPRAALVLHERQLQAENARSDLAFFGARDVKIEPAAATTAIIDAIRRLATDNPVALLGIHYVFEGSKNGAAFLAPRLRKAYGLTGADGMRYFDPHGPEQRPLWAAFKLAMDGIEFTPAEQDAMVAAAKATFDHIAALDDELYAEIAVA